MTCCSRQTYSICTTLESEISALRNFGVNRSGVHTDIAIRSEFAALSPQIANNNIPLIKAYSAWKKQEWQKLESLLPIGDWPPYRGFVKRSEGVFEPGMLFDRFGGRFKNGVFFDGGSFVSPAETPFTSEGYRIVRYMLRRVSIKCLSQLKGIMAQQFHGLNRKEWEFNGSSMGVE